MAKKPESLIKWLAISHYVTAVVLAFGHSVAIKLILSAPVSPLILKEYANSRLWMMLPYVVVYVVEILLAFLMILAGWSLAQRKNYKFIFMVECLECINIPLGTLLAIFAITMLRRDSVKAIFGSSRPPLPTAPNAATKDWDY